MTVGSVEVTASHWTTANATALLEGTAGALGWTTLPTRSVQITAPEGQLNTVDVTKAETLCSVANTAGQNKREGERNGDRQPARRGQLQGAHLGALALR